MTILCSVTANNGNGAFYHTSHLPNDVPADSVEISPEEHARLLAGMNLRGAKLVLKDGKPDLQERQMITDADLMRAHRRRRTAMLSETDFSADTPKAVVAKYSDYRQKLRDWPSTIKDPRNPPPLPVKPE